MKVILGISLLLLTSCGESLEAGRLVYRDKRCVSNGDREGIVYEAIESFTHDRGYKARQTLSELNEVENDKEQEN